MPSKLITVIPATGAGTYYSHYHHDTPVAAAQSTTTVAMVFYDSSLGWRFGVSTDSGSTWSSIGVVGGQVNETGIWPDAAGTGFWLISGYGTGCSVGGCSGGSWAPVGCCACSGCACGNAGSPCCDVGACANPCGSCASQSVTGCSQGTCGGSAAIYIYRWTPAGFSAAASIGNPGCSAGGCSVASASEPCCTSGSLGSCAASSCGYGTTAVFSMVGDTLCYYQEGGTQRYTLSGGTTAGGALSLTALGNHGLGNYSTSVMVDTANGIRMGASGNGGTLALYQINAAVVFAETVDAGTAWSNQNVPVVYDGTALYAFAWTSTTSLNVYKRSNLTFGAAQTWALQRTYTGLPVIGATGKFAAGSSRTTTGRMFAAYSSTAIHAQGDIILIDLTTGATKTIYDNTSNTGAPQTITFGQGNGVPLHYISYNGTVWSQNMYAQIWDNPSSGRRGYQEPIIGERGRGLFSTF